MPRPWPSSSSSSIASAMPPAVIGRLDHLVGVASELVGEHPAPERPESEPHLKQVADDVGRYEVGDVLHGQRHVGHSQLQDVAREVQRGHAQQHADAAEREEQQGLVMAFAAAAVPEAPFPIQNVGRDDRDDSRR